MFDVIRRGSEHRNTSPIIYLFLSTKYSNKLTQYFGYRIPKRKFRLVFHPYITLEYILAPHLKIPLSPREKIKRSERWVIKGNLRGIPCVHPDHDPNTEKNPT